MQVNNVLRIDVFSKYLILHKATKQSAVASPDFFADFRFLLILDFWFGLSVKDVLSCVCHYDAESENCSKQCYIIILRHLNPSYIGQGNCMHKLFYAVIINNVHSIYIII